jgi:microcompartment protein CcmL/EutN
MNKSLGMIEVISIPAGIEAGDAMLKAASVRLVSATAVCAGKYIVIVTGEVAAVRSAVKAGREAAGIKLIDDLIIPNVHEQVPMAINACTDIGEMAAVGVMETYSLCAAIIAADEAVKAAEITLIEIRLGRGLGGKSFVTMTGEVAAVKASVEAAQGIEEVQGLMSGSVVIPAPHPDIAKALF